MDLFDLNEVESAKTPPVYTDGTEKIAYSIPQEWIDESEARLVDAVTAAWRDMDQLDKELARIPVNPEDGHMYFKSVDVDDALKTIKAIIGDRKVNLNVSWDSWK